MLEFDIEVVNAPRGLPSVLLPAVFTKDLLPMSSLLARLSSFLLGGQPSQSSSDLPLLNDVPTSSSKPSFFRPFTRRDTSSAASSSDVSALSDQLVAIREAIDRQGQRHEDLMTYLSHLPKAMESMPENARLQAEALAAIKQHLENQGTMARQISTIMDKVGQASVDQRRILDSVRMRLDMLAETDQKVAEHFNSFATALSTSTDTTRLTGELLTSLETNIRQRDEALERIIHTHQTRHTLLLAAAIILSAAALIASTVGMFLFARAS